ncbi:Putative F0F1-ATPase subunit Ca2+/Mg2+ transporter [Alkalithermobacter thermoalcaliphilus JW-YL-7 = DSM 7308]|uniref:F0F1-ATPase subunit Ca2+/Mg2+ transporter n=1 Tax=Alkalithermobacter thermoalcaliphilus JW-YL-7 = DSM 7308 TaxID=1121328 RepID=A0A150FU20_CLOPD|nr:hypothetical protein JWYL7_1605 [[Clostridium] paradoxum JW-YL-7 = DSM 7308]SHK71735.1 Putative F0F1-ATPase subunit Ca2+/Mg2+ transporter [[Clostridium] paradoxum JW-YL-7 = DSM 7308]
MSKKSKWIDSLQNLSLLSQIGISMVTPIIVCVLIGNYIDERLNLSPLFLFIFIVLGVISAFINLYKIALRDKKKGK